MRVIAGEFRSRRLKALRGMTLRPTPDRLRQVLFDVVGPRVRDAVFIDAYAGAGSVGIEALSRGALRAIFLEKHPAAVRVLRENLASLGLGQRALVIPGSALASLSHMRADIVFLDPPYELEIEYAAALEALGRNPPALVIAQHSTHTALERTYGRLKRKRVVKAGSNCLSFFETDPSVAPV